MEKRSQYGISYPVQRGSTGYFEPTYDSIRSSVSNLRNLILTRPGTRPGKPAYGCRLWTVLFEQNEDFIEDIASDIITQDIETWLPEISVIRVQVGRSSEDIDIYSLGVTIIFRVSSDSEAQSLFIDVNL